VTPVNPWRRIGAKLIDAIFIGVVYGFLSKMAGAVFAAFASYTLFLALDAQPSPGKRLLGLRVLDASRGGAPGVGQSVLRNLIFLPDFARTLVRAEWGREYDRALGILSLVGVFIVALEIRWMFNRKDGRRLGDAFGDTRVVSAR
jgi:uncharacterized RDD family membrane protein YckC